MKPRLFLAPDNESSPAGGTSPAAAAPVAIPAASSPTGADIPGMPARESKPAVVVQPAPIKQKGIVDPRKAFGLEKKPSEAVKEEAKALSERSKTSTIIPVPKIKSKGDTEPAKADEKPPETPTLETKTEVHTTTAPVAKVKIGDKEMTPEEVTAHIAELEKKAAKAAETKVEKPVETTPKKELTPEEQAAEDKRLDDEFLTGRGEAYLTSEKELDEILSGGPKALKLFREKLASAELNTRKWVEATLNPILQEIDKRLNPVVKQYAEVEQYQREANFLTKYPDIKAAPNGVIEYRKVAQELHAYYDRVQQLIASNVATAQEVEYAKTFETLTPDQFNESVATRARLQLGIRPGATTSAAATPSATPAATPQPAAAAPTPKPQPRPATGNMGGTGAPANLNPQAAMIAKLIASGK